MISNIEKLKKISFGNEIKIVSFDIFDTLLIRKVDPPDEVKRIVSLNTTKSGLLLTSPNELLSLRNSVELRLRKEAKKNSFDPECSVEEIIEHIIKELKEDINIKEKLLHLELEVEKSLIVPMPGIKSLLKELGTKYKLIAISDTYFPVWMLRKLLNSSGLGDFLQEIYSSCEYKLSKGSGRLFEKVLELEQINRSQMIHIGDNFLSDYFIPKSMGIDSILLYEEWNLKRRGLLRLLTKKEKKSAFWKGYSFIYRLSSVEQERNAKDPEGLYSWGKNVIGPLLAVFIHTLTQEVQKENFQRLYFIAREGFLLKKLFNLFSEYLYGNKNYKSLYLCISRYTSFVASIQRLSDRELKYATWGSNLRISDVLHRLGIQDIEGIKDLLIKHNLAPFESFNNDKTEKSFFNLCTNPEFTKIVIKNSQIMRELLEQYLRQLGFFSNGSRIALIDVGWTGTIQDCIEEIFGESPDFPAITGYYLALNPPITKSQRNKKGLIYDFRKSYPEEMSITFFREALEFSCRSYHGSTIGYKKLGNGRIIPLFDKHSYNWMLEKQINKYILLIQKGIIDFAKEYLRLVKILSINPIELQPFVVKLYDLYLGFPPKEYINALEKVVNTDDFGSDKIRTIVKNFSLKEMLLSSDKFFQSLIETPWREASLSKMGIPFLSTCYYLVKRLVCWNRIKKNISYE